MSIFKLCVIYVNFSKSFDRVYENILIKKLKRYGVRSNMHSLIGSFLMEENSLLALEDMSQPVKKVKLGLPQGSVLGPLLCTI